MKKLKNNFSFLISHLSSRKGFTLIELLIVIVIIGILSAFLTANFVGVRERARDSQRKSDLKQIQAALEMYRADKGYYPFGTASEYSAGLNWVTSASLPYRLTVTGQTIYMQTVPGDPVSGATCDGGSTPEASYIYSTSQDGTQYTLFAALENANDSEGSTYVKPAPYIASNVTYTNTGGLNTNKYISATAAPGSRCIGETYNYWVNNP